MQITSFHTVKTPMVAKPKAPPSAAIRANQQKIAFLIANGMTFEEAYAAALANPTVRYAGKVKSTSDGTPCVVNGVGYQSIKAAARATGLSERKISKIRLNKAPEHKRTARPCVINGVHYDTIAKAATALKMGRETIRTRIVAGCEGYAWFQ
jgi:hypothetical protein